MGALLWSGWYVWAALIFLFGQVHPDPLDDITRLGTPHKIVAILVLLVFVLTFTPLPMQVLTGELPGLEAGQAACCPGLFALLLGLAWLNRRWRTSRACSSLQKKSH
jgi:hypothetical protein